MKSARNAAENQHQPRSAGRPRGAGWRRVAVVIAASSAVGLAACGGDDGSTAAVTTTATVSAEHPESVAAAERAVYTRVGNLLASARAEYPDDGYPVTDGQAVCRPFSDFQLDCTQKVRDEDDGWTGTTRWRASIDPKTGKATVVEHGGRSLADQLGINQSCLEDGVAC